MSKVKPFLLGGVIFLLDFLSKWFVHHNIPLMAHSAPWYPYGGIPVFSDFLGIEFSITHAANRGAAWGLGADYQIPLLILRIGMIAALILYLLFWNKDKKSVLPLTMVIAGALGNIVDFFLYGHVVDMLHFVLWGYDFPVFNLADASIFLGVVWLIFASSR